MRGDLETEPAFTRFSSTAAREARTISDEDDAQFLRDLAGAPSLARTIEDGIRRLLNEAPPEAMMTMGGRDIEVRVVGLDGDQYTISTIDQNARMRPEVDGGALSLDLGDLAMLAARRDGLNDAELHVASYLWFRQRTTAGTWFARTSDHRLSKAFAAIDESVAAALRGETPPAAQVADGGGGDDGRGTAGGDLSPQAFSGNGLSMVGSAVRWTCQEVVEIGQNLRDRDLPEAVWQAPVPTGRCTIELQVRPESRILIGLRRDGIAVRVGLDSSDQRITGIVTKSDGGLTVSPSIYSYPAAGDRLTLVAILEPDGTLQFELNGKTFSDQFHREMTYELPGNGAAELVLQSLDRDGNASVDIFSISHQP